MMVNFHCGKISPDSSVLQRIPKTRKHFGDLCKLRTKSIKLYITTDSCVPLVASEQSSSGSDGAECANNPLNWSQAPPIDPYKNCRPSYQGLFENLNTSGMILLLSLSFL